jgi:hypothetical protein
MPKKSTTARGGTQRNRPRTQKGFEVVRQTSSEELVIEDIPKEAALASHSTTPTPATEPARAAKKAATRVATVATPEVQEEQESPVTTIPAPKGSAAARLAARRQGQRSQLKSSVTLITAEHYSYVKRDLVIIAVLASFMFVAIIVLYFVLGKGF